VCYHEFLVKDTAKLTPSLVNYNILPIQTQYQTFIKIYWQDISKRQNNTYINMILCLNFGDLACLTFSIHARAQIQLCLTNLNYKLKNKIFEGFG